MESRHEHFYELTPDMQTSRQGPGPRSIYHTQGGTSGTYMN